MTSPAWTVAAPSAAGGVLAGFAVSGAVAASGSDALGIAGVLLMVGLGLVLARSHPLATAPAALGAWLGALVAYELVPSTADEEAPLLGDPVVFLVMTTLYLGLFALPVLAGGWLGSRLRRGGPPTEGAPRTPPDASGRSAPDAPADPGP